jgi:hypothetical protein
MNADVVSSNEDSNAIVEAIHVVGIQNGDMRIALTGIGVGAPSFAVSFAKVGQVYCNIASFFRGNICWVKRRGCGGVFRRVFRRGCGGVFRRV